MESSIRFSNDTLLEEILQIQIRSCGGGGEFFCAVCYLPLKEILSSLPFSDIVPRNNSPSSLVINGD